MYCQLERTTLKTLTRREYVPTERVLAELEDRLKTGGEADYLTLSGSGEPTLHSRLGDVLEFIRSNSIIPVVLLTNGTMLHIPEVRDAASLANVVKISLSAWDQASYWWVNRPHSRLKFAQLLEGEEAFRARFKGRLWLEVFLIAGMNSTPADVRKIAALAENIRPDRIHMNTAVRPPTEDFAAFLPEERMAGLTHLFHPTAEVIGAFSANHRADIGAPQEEIMSMLQRRPCTSDQIAEAFGMHLNEVSKYVGNMLRDVQTMPYTMQPKARRIKNMPMYALN